MIAKTARMFMIAGTLALTVGGALPASANDADVIRQGSCSGRSDWKLKLSPDNGRIEVEFEVDSNVNGQTWHVRILQNGERIFSGNRVTQAPSGSFDVRKLANNTAGTDRFRARAVNGATGETCAGAASI
ncbi:MAG: hypothetical protein M3P10_00485 [Actinomycetota bacterium]|nr:hypothetical protein [Actinomycetota bacterium]